MKVQLQESSAIWHGVNWLTSTGTSKSEGEETTSESPSPPDRHWETNFDSEVLLEEESSPSRVCESFSAKNRIKQ